MPDQSGRSVAIIDYGLGNLYSVVHACEYVGLRADITSSKKEILRADAVILPGVGAFGEAMKALSRLDLVELLRDVAAAGKPFVGICLGMQMLMSESHEFGRHRGLGLIKGEVVRLEASCEAGRHLKVPQVGWNRIWAAPERQGGNEAGKSAWQGSLLEGIEDGAFMYFVHSFYCKPSAIEVVFAESRYGTVTFSSAIRLGNIVGFQFHPERSGPQGLRIYQNLSASIHWSG